MQIECSFQMWRVVFTRTVMQFESPENRKIGNFPGRKPARHGERKPSTFSPSTETNPSTGQYCAQLLRPAAGDSRWPLPVDRYLQSIAPARFAIAALPPDRTPAD